MTPYEEADRIVDCFTYDAQTELLTSALAAAIEVLDAHWNAGENCYECGQHWPCFTERTLGAVLPKLYTIDRT